MSSGSPSDSLSSSDSSSYQSASRLSSVPSVPSVPHNDSSEDSSTNSYSESSRIQVHIRFVVLGSILLSQFPIAARDQV